MNLAQRIATGSHGVSTSVYPVPAFCGEPGELRRPSGNAKRINVSSEIEFLSEELKANFKLSQTHRTDASGAIAMLF